MEYTTTNDVMNEVDNLCIEVQKFLQNECHYSVIKSQMETINLLKNNGYMDDFWKEENLFRVIDFLKDMLKLPNYLKDTIYLQQLNTSDLVN